MRTNWAAGGIGLVGTAVILIGMIWLDMWQVSVMGLSILQLAYWERIGTDLAELRERVEADERGEG